MDSPVKPVSCYHTMHRLLKALHREGWHARNDTPDASLIVSFLLSCVPDLSYRLAHLHDYMKKDRQQSMQEPNFSSMLSSIFLRNLRYRWRSSSFGWAYYTKVPFKSSSLTTPSLTTPFKKSKFKSTLVCMNFLLLLRRI